MRSGWNANLRAEQLEDRALLAATLSATLDGSNNLVIDDTSGTAANQLTVSRSGVNLVITDTTEQFAASAISGAVLSNSDKTITIPAASVTGTKIIVTGQGGSDSLTVNLSTDLGFDVEYLGGSGTSDSLTISGGSVNTVTHSVTNANDGSVAVVTGITRNISYTGLEPVTDNLSATDRIFNFNGGAETVTLNDALGPNMTLDSTLGEAITFSNPSNSLTINLGTGNDTINLDFFDGIYDASLTINGDDGTDQINVNDDITLTGSKSIALTAEGIDVAGGTLSTTTGNQNYNGPLSLTGSKLTTTSTGAIHLGGTVTVNGTSASTIAGNLQLNSATRTFTVNDVVVGDDLIVSANIAAGADGIVKGGVGEMLLSGNNAYTGATLIQDSILALGSNTALGTTSGVTATATATGGGGVHGSRVELRNVTITGIPLTLNSNSVGDLRSGLLTTTTGTNTWTGPITVQGSGQTYFAAGNDAGENLVVSGNVTGVGFTGTHKIRTVATTGLGAGTLNGIINLGTGVLFKDDENNWTINSTGNTASVTQVGRGTLTVGTTNALATAGRLQMGDAHNFAAKLILNGFDQQVSSIVKVASHTGAARIVNGGASQSALTINTTMTADYSGFIGDTTAADNNIRIIKQGTGSQTLSGINSYSGTTTIQAGILGTGSNSANIGDGSATNTLIFTGGTFLMGGFVSPLTRSVQFLTDATIRDGGANNTIQGQITGPGGLVKQQNGVLNLNNGTNTFGGVGKTISLEGGTVSGASDAAWGDTANNIVFVANDPTLRATSTFSTNRSMSLSGNGRFDATGGSTFTVNGLVSGAGQLSMGSVGANGTVVMANGSNTYTGATHVDFGTLVVTTDHALGATTAGTDASSLTVIDFQNVNYTTTETLQLNNATLRVSTGSTTLAGPVQLNAGTPTINIIGTALTLNGVVSGPQNSTKTGTGTLTLNANNTFNGTLTASAGNVIVNGTNAGGFTMQNTTSLSGTGSTTGPVTLQSGSTISPGPTTSIFGTGNLSFSSGSTYSVNLNGTVAGTNYDQLNTTGTVSLGNATLSINVGFSPNNNDSFVIINNDGSDSVTGTFNGLPENSLITIGPNSYLLTYAGGTGNDVVLRADTVGPSAQAFARFNPLAQNTNADSLVYRVTFSEAVQNVDATDFVVTGTTATVTGVAIVSTSQYDLTISGGDLAAFNGTVGLDLNPAQNITDLASQALASTEPPIDESYIIDNIAPSTTSFTLQNPPTTNTNADTLIFLVTFSEPVTNIDPTDFVVTGSTGTIVVTPIVPGVYTVTVSGGNTPTFNGTVGLNFSPTENITDLAGNALPNTEPTIDQSFALDNIAPTTTSFTRFNPATQNTSADTLIFRATFSEPVTNVNSADFVVNSTTTATITAVNAFSSSIYEITVSGGDLASFNGTVSLNFDASQNISDLSGNALPTTEPATDESYNVDNSDPSVVSFTRFNPSTSPTNADTLVFRALFSEAVTNISAADFVLDTLSTATITGFNAVSSTLYELTVSGGDLAVFNGAVGLDLDATQDITDLAGNVLPTLEPTTDEVYVIDNTIPTLLSFTRFNPASSPTNANTLIFRATFDEDVQNVSLGDFSVNGGTTATVTAVTPITGNIYDITVSGGDLAGFNGTVGIDLHAAQNITDLAGIALPATEPATDETYVVDNLAPSTLSISLLTPASPNTSADTLIFQVTFSEPVINVTSGDFNVSGGTTGGITLVSVVNASTYNITVSGGNLATFNGTVGLNIAAGQNITDLAGNALPVTEPAIDQTYSVDNSDPTVLSFTRFNPATSPTSANTLVFRAFFSEAVTNISTADFVLDTLSTATITGFSTVSPTLYELTISGGDLAGFNGTVGLDLDAAQDITDLAGNALPTLEPATDEVYVLDNTTPTLLSFTRFNPATSPTNANTLIFRATFDEDVQNVSLGDFSVNGGTTATVTAVTPITGNIFDITVSGGDLAGFNGTVGIDLHASQNITDLASIPLPTTEPATDETYVVDNLAPSTLSISLLTPASPNTSADTLIFQVTFSEPVVNVTSGDFNVSGGTTGSITLVSVVNASTYNITVSGGNLATFNGTVGLNIAAGQNITDLAGNALPVTEPATDQTYSVDNSDPSVVSFTRFNPATSPTNADTLIFRALFSEAVTNISTADFVLDTLSSATITGFNAVSPTLYELTISGGDLAVFNGTVGLDLDAAQDIIDLAGNVLPTLEPATDEVYVVDNTTPTLLSFTRFNPATSPTNANTLIFRATFDEDVQNVSVVDFSVNGGTAATVTAVTPITGNIYDITVSGGDLAGFNGTVGIDLHAAQDITDLANIALPTTEPATDETYVVDNTAPSTLSIIRFNPSAANTNADTLIFQVTFDESVLNVTTGDFTVNSATTATVTAVSAVNASTYNVTVSGGNLSNFNGTVGLNISATEDIVDLAGNALPITEPAIDQIYTVDNADPAVASFTRFNPATSPTNANTLIFRAQFTEDVLNVGIADFVVDSTSTATVTAVAQISPSLYEVTVSGGDLAAFNGLVGLDLDAAQDITDLAGNALPTLEPGIDQTYLLDNDAPVLTAFTRFNPLTSPTSANTLVFRATFGEDVINVTPGDFTVTGGTTATVVIVATVSPSIYEITVQGGDLTSFNGTVGLDLGALQDITDLTGNALPTVEPAIDQTYVLDNLAPVTTSFARFNPLAAVTDSDTLEFQITFSEDVLNVSTNDFTVTGASGTVSSLSVVNGSTYNLLISGGNLATFNGVVGLNFAMVIDITDLSANPLPNTEPAIDETYTVDNTDPSITSFTRFNPATSPTSANVLIFRAQFSEAVLNVGTADFVVDSTTTATVTAVAQVSPSLYEVTVSGGDLAGFNGTVGIDFDAAQDITDLGGNPLPTLEPAIDETYVVDNTAPSTTSFTRFNPAMNPTSANVLVFRAQFSEDVLNVSTGDFTVNGGTTATVTAINPISASLYEVTVSGGNLSAFNGTVGIDLAVAQNITDLAGTALPTTEPSIDEVYDVDNAPPSLLSFARHNPLAASTNANTLVFRATFSEDMLNVDTTDFAVNSTTTATITSVNPVSPNVYDITVSGGDLATFNGTVSLDLLNTHDITDIANTPLPNGEPAIDESYLVDNTAPGAVSFTRFNPLTSPTNADTLVFRALFDSPVFNVGVADFVVDSTTTATVTGVNPVSSTLYEITVSGGDLAGFNGSVGIDFDASQDIVDAAGNALPTLEPAIDETYDVDNTAPIQASFTRFNPASSPTNADTLIFRATFNEDVANVSIGDFQVDGTTTATVTAVTPVSGSLYEVTVSGGDLAGFNGLVGINFAAGQDITDLAGNPLTTAEPLIDETYLVDNIDPELLSFTRFNPATSPTNADTLVLRATFNEAVVNVTFDDFNVDGLTTATVTSINPVSGTIYEVTVSGGDLATFNGTVGIDLSPLHDITDVGGTALPSFEPVIDESYDIDNDAPDVVSFTYFIPASSPTAAASLTFRVTFDEAVTNVSIGDFTVDSTTTATVTAVSMVSPTEFNVTISGGDLATFSGTVGLDFDASQDITDIAGNALPTLEPAVDQVYVLDNTAPVLAITRLTPATSPTNANSLVFRLTFSEAVMHVDAGDFVVTGTTATITGFVPSVLNSYDVTVSGGNLAGLNGTVGLDLDPGQNIVDLVLNPLPTVEPLVDETYLVDNIGPTVDITNITPDPRFAPVTSITIVFNEAVTGLTLGDLSLTRNAGPNLLLGTETLSTLDNITWTLTGINLLTTPDGAYDITLTAAPSITDLAGNPLTIGATDSWTTLPATYDMGDAPDTYGTSLANNGPIHFGTGLMLGTLRDNEGDASPPLNGTGDDSTTSDDEDGSIVLAPIVRFGSSAIQVTLSAPGFLDAWLDLDADGTFDDPAERFGSLGLGSAGSLALPGGTTTIPFNVPSYVTAIPTQTYARFRLSSTGGLAPVEFMGSFAIDGEVEDQIGQIIAAPFYVQVDDDYAGATPGDVLDGGIFGVDRFDTLAQALLVVADTGTVGVKPGTYPENVVITKNVLVDGLSGNASDVIIDPPGSATAGIFIDNGMINVEINDLSVTDACNGIESLTTGTLFISNVDSSNNSCDGIYIVNASSVDLIDSVFNYNADDGIDFFSGGNLSVVTTNASNNGDFGLESLLAGDILVEGGAWSGMFVRSANSFALQSTPATSTKRVDIEVNNDLSIETQLDVGANLIRLLANQDSAGTQGFSMGADGQLTTTNDTPSAVLITVNSFLGGTGKAELGLITAGPTGGSLGGRVTVTAANGQILDDNLGFNNIDAGSVVLSAAGGVGTSIDPIDGTVLNLQGGGGTGGFYFENTGALIIGEIFGGIGISTTTGDIRVIAHSPLTVAADVIGGGLIFLHAGETVGTGDDLKVETGVTVRSTNNNVDLEAGDDIYLEAGSLIEAPLGTVFIKGDCANADALGSFISIDGIINSLGGALVNGDTDGDDILVNAMGTGGLKLDGLGGNDKYRINYPDLPTTFGSTITVDDSVGGTDLVTVFGTNNPDELFLTTQDPPTTATTEELSRGAVGTERIVLHNNIEKLDVYLLDHIDIMHAEPSTLFPVFLDGGEPCFGDPGVPPGDQLVFDPLGNSFTINGATLSTAGAPPFFDINFVNFESLPLAPLGAPPGGQLLFDFNHTNTASTVVYSPTQAGYIGVNRDTLYSGGLGYGWEFQVKSFERDDGFYDNTYADLTRDGHWLEAAAIFTVDLPNGWYLASAMVGNPYTSITGAAIKNADNGATLVNNIVTGPGESKHYAFPVLVTDGTLDLQFVHATSNPTIFAVNGLSIRPGKLLTMGLDCAVGTLEADGVSVDSFTLYEAPPNSFITVATSLGTIMNADVDDELNGIQIKTNALGQATIQVRRPTGAGTAIITFEEVTGAATGVSAVTYVFPSSRRFDFNHVNVTSSTAPSPTQTPVASITTPNGYLGVPQTTLYNAGTGYGWIASPKGFDLGGPTNSQGESIPDPDPLGNLRRDGAIDSIGRTFRVDLPNGTYRYEATIGYDHDIDGMQINANGSIISDIAVAAGNRVQINGTFTVVGGFANFAFSDQYGPAPNWVLNGLEIRPAVVIAPIVFMPNIGGTPADGLTITPITATTTLPDGEQVTVDSTLGTIITPDVNPSIDGVQVYVSSGQIFFELLAPTVPGTPTFTATSLDGSHRGTINDPLFLDYEIAAKRRFDFNHTRSNSSTGPSNTAFTFYGVVRTDIDRLNDGFGWNQSPHSYDNYVPNEHDHTTFPTLTTDLYSDWHSGHVTTGGRTFSVQAAPGATYDLTIYLGSGCHDISPIVTVEGIALPQTINLESGNYDYLQFFGAFDADMDGYIEILFDATGAISNYWATNGLDIVEVPTPMPLPAPLMGLTRGDGYGVDPLTEAQLNVVIAQALDFWEDKDITAQQLEVLTTAQFVIRDLGDNAGLAWIDGNGVINIDDNGAGHGWSLTPDKPNGDRYDLFTAIAHELGHLLGLEDLDPHTDGNDLMSAFIGLGERHTVISHIDDVFSGPPH